MLKLSIKSATNLPSLNNNPTKFRIKIYGVSFIYYSLGKTQYSSKINSPVFNEDFLFDIFRIGHEIKFIVYGKQFFKSKFLVGDASINLLEHSYNPISGVLNTPISQKYHQLKHF